MVEFQIESRATNRERSELFEAVERKPNLASVVVSEIEKAIIAGRLKSGERLPTERELGRQFNVSRTVVREAIHMLAAKNLVEVQAGSGMVVRNPSTQTISESLHILLNIGRPDIQPEELTEVRRCLEIEIAGLSAQRRTGQNLAELAELIDQMKRAKSADEFSECDMAFHLKLAQATQNRLYLVLLDSIIDVIRNVSFITSLDPEKRHKPIQYHHRILEQVAAQNINGARKAMREHLVSFEKAVRDISLSSGD